MVSLIRVVVIATICGWALVSEGASTEKLQYNRDIRPILSDRCFKCHGPDKGSRKAGLRLDVADEAYAARKKSGKHAIVPGKPDESLVCRKIFATDPDDLMPPPESNLSLTPSEKETLRRWIAQGAVYQPHWAFIPPPAIVPVPPVKNRGWPRNEIDRFILARLEKEGMKPSPPASKERWLRRVSYDLTGLPPTPQEVDAFFADKKSDAYEKVVDRLLASKQFGERMAVPWLDGARYADSYGYQSDQLCPTWPYRDWVVNAFNRNLPYNRFLTEQLAGDLLPGAGREERLATAFNRLHRQTNEGGSIEEEWRTEYVADRVQTFGTVALGLTFECTRCHDHKFDPLTQRDYYGLAAFFNSIDEYGLYNDAAHVPTPSMLLPTEKQEKEMERTDALLKEKRKELRRAMEQGRKIKLQTSNFNETSNSKQQAPNFRQTSNAKLRPSISSGNDSLVTSADTNGIKQVQSLLTSAATNGLVGRFSFDDVANGVIRNLVPGKDTDGKLNENSIVAGRSGKAVRFNGDAEVTFPNLIGSLQPWEEYSVVFWIRFPKALTNAIIFHREEGTDTGFHGTELALQNGRLFFVIKRFWPGNAIAVRSLEAVPGDEWVQIGVSYDGCGQARGMRFYVNGTVARSEVVRDHLTKSPQNGGSGFSFGALFRSTGLKGAEMEKVLIFNRTLSEAEMGQNFKRQTSSFSETSNTKHQAPSSRENSSSNLQASTSYLPSSISNDIATELGEDDYVDSAPRVREARREVQEALKAYYGARNPVVETMVMEDMAQARPSYVLYRGRYDSPKTEDKRVYRCTPAVLPAFPANAPSNRLGLAEWLVQPNHPLTARVAVNRFWQMLFGRGIVASIENFGVQGTPPTHPELLDWLARDFVNSGWDVKAMLKKIVLSATYRQDSRMRPDLKDKDPENLLLARGPSQRLPAEMVRDTALAASGLLVEKLGGPWVSPYSPGDLWRENNSMSPAYQQSTGENLYRRSLYTVWKRTAPMPDMITFDAPSREVCLVKRSVTSTPQQAFVLLNDTQFVEAARVLAEKAMKMEMTTSGRVAPGQGTRPAIEGNTVPREVEWIFRRLTGRKPDNVEMTILTELLGEQQKQFEAEPDRAEKLVSVGASKRDKSLDVKELAAMTTVAQAVMNSDATVWKR